MQDITCIPSTDRLPKKRDIKIKTGHWQLIQETIFTCKAIEIPANAIDIIETPTF